MHQEVIDKQNDLQEVTFYPGDRVMVFDPSLYQDDVSTPLSKTLQPATVLCWYGKTCTPPASMMIGENPWKYERKYESLIDVQFDHDGRISRGHFTLGVKKISS